MALFHPIPIHPIPIHPFHPIYLIFLVLGHGIHVIGLKQRKIEFKSRTKLSQNNNNKYCITSMTIRQLLMFKPNADTPATCPYNYYMERWLLCPFGFKH